MFKIDINMFKDTKVRVFKKTLRKNDFRRH